MSTVEPDATAWPRVLAVVVTHNGRRWLPGCLKSLALQTYPSLEVVIVDNASEDPEGVLRLVHRLLPTASVLRLELDAGFGSAANRALELAPDARDAEYYLFMHDDVALDRECVGMLVSSALETDAGVVGGKGLSWDEPEVLLEVGMAADEFGYPVSGLEEGEIDQGQHDIRREVLFVTSACLLVSRTTVERCGSWDVGYVVFGEDLDLCIRARLSGFPVIVAPKGVFYHAVAMATGRREVPPAESVRYYTRRNRLRTIAKNTSATRVLLLIALYTGVLSAEVVLLAGLRRFDEIPPYFRAYLWFLRSLPDVARRRRAVQRRRTVPDRRVRRYMVRDLPRARIFLERRLVAWGEETVRFGAKTFAYLSPVALAGRLRRWVRSPGFLVCAAIILALLIAARHVLLGGLVGGGSLWPFPAGMHRLLADYLAGWRDIGLGSSGAPPPALPLLWLAQLVSLGSAAVAQKVLVAGLLATGLVGVHRFVKRRSAFLPARIVALGVYALAPVLRLTLMGGDVGALALYAFGPFLLDAGLRLLGPTPGAGGVRAAVADTVDALSRQTIRLALLSAVIIALAPSALVVILSLWLVVGLHSWWGSALSGDTGRRWGWLLGSVVASLVMLVPWSLESLGSRGAVLGPVLAGPGGGPALRPLWAPIGFARALLLAPGMSFPAGVVALAVLAGALLVTSTARRREVRALALVIVTFGLIAGAVGKGYLPAPTATPALWLVIPLAALAVCAGYLVAALAEDLPRHAAGWRQTVGGVAVVAFGIGALAGWVPTLLSWGSPPSSEVTGTGPEAAALGAVRGAAVTSGSEFRVLWLGRSFVEPIRSAVLPTGPVPYLVTGSGGLTMLDTQASHIGSVDAWLSGVVGDLTTGRTHLAGHLLAPAAIRFLIVDRSDTATLAAVARQKDLVLSQELLVRNAPAVDLFENAMALPVAGLAPASVAGALGTTDPAGLVLAQWPAKAGAVPGLGRLSLGSFAGTIPAGVTGTVLLAEPYSSRWEASIGGRPMQHALALGWANSFIVPAGAGGRVHVNAGGEWVRIVWVTVEGLILLLALAMGSILHLPESFTLPNPATLQRASAAPPGGPASPPGGPAPGPATPPPARGPAPVPPAARGPAPVPAPSDGGPAGRSSRQPEAPPRPEGTPPVGAPKAPGAAAPSGPPTPPTPGAPAPPSPAPGPRLGPWAPVRRTPPARPAGGWQPPGTPSGPAGPPSPLRKLGSVWPGNRPEQPRNGDGPRKPR